MTSRTSLHYLEQRHQALERDIAEAMRRHPVDEALIADLRYRKLIIADEILHDRRIVEHFESQER